VDVIYPPENRLALEVRDRGAVVSQFPSARHRWRLFSPLAIA